MLGAGKIFRGYYAAASLKLVCSVTHASSPGQIFRGYYAAASLKRFITQALEPTGNDLPRLLRRGLIEARKSERGSLNCSRNLPRLLRRGLIEAKQSSRSSTD